ncbi:MAG: Phospho-N-acetylmuramoyl-pentapeptide-transferase [Bacteroidetes bacterium ADurb.Bin408]|nr:MAG: Phospho-N-acetylmuramoyl-pentapeptide-transferase [Bacteroidetes bacterium ADurb.Bin408]
MLYYLFKYLDTAFNLPGAGAFQYISTRSGLALITSLIISMIFGKQLIALLRKKQVGETIRDLGLEGQKEKEGTPTMGGLIILGAILVPTLLFAKLNNIYIIMLIITTVWLGLLGFIDDYIKVFKKDKKGLSGKMKIFGQVVLGLIIGVTMLYHKDIVIREKTDTSGNYITPEGVFQSEATSNSTEIYNKTPVKSTKTTIPFIKNNELDYARILSF